MTRSVLRLAPLAIAYGCASPGPATVLPPPPREPRVAGDAGPTPAAARDVPSVDALVARGAALAPLMRLALRVVDPEGRNELTFERDTCFRALVAASEDVEAVFVDGSRAARGGAFRGMEGAVPPDGPACAKAREPIQLVVRARAGTVVRGVVLVSP